MFPIIGIMATPPVYTDLSVTLEKVLQILYSAGEILMRDYDTPPDVARKPDGSLVTPADKEVSKFMEAQLSEHFRDYGILIEEKPDDGSRFRRRFSSYVDPLDSTHDYVSKEKGWGIIFGLNDYFTPVVGATYQPHLDEIVYAIKGGGAFRIYKGGPPERISVSGTEQIDMLKHRYQTTQQQVELINRIKPRSITRMGGALKIVEIAKGNGTLALFPPDFRIHHWDVCGPQVILQEAGGRITDLQGNTLDYDQQDTVFRKGVIASNGIIHDSLVQDLNAPPARNPSR